MIRMFWAFLLSCICRLEEQSANVHSSMFEMCFTSGLASQSCNTTPVGSIHGFDTVAIEPAMEPQMATLVAKYKTCNVERWPSSDTSTISTGGSSDQASSRHRTSQHITRYGQREVLISNWMCPAPSQYT
eukprot:c16282_g1_i1 orf=3-389(-)